MVETLEDKLCKDSAEDRLESRSKAEASIVVKMESGDSKFHVERDKSKENVEQWDVRVNSRQTYQTQQIRMKGGRKSELIGMYGAHARSHL